MPSCQWRLEQSSARNLVRLADRRVAADLSVDHARDQQNAEERTDGKLGADPHILDDGHNRNSQKSAVLYRGNGVPSTGEKIRAAVD